MTLAKRVLVGAPMRSENLGETLLPKRVALPIFSSDALSSVAYATEAILKVLTVGGLAYLYLTPWVALAVALLMTIVVVSYRQVIHAYPDGGGSYEVVRQNLGRGAGMVVAASLMVDYVMTVAVSVAAGVDNVISAVPSLNTQRVLLAVGCVAVLTLVNLRGVRESGRAFAVPTYLFIVGIIAMVGIGLFQTAVGHAPVAVSATYQIREEAFGLTGIALLMLGLRAFSSGCTALTGVEAISNGVPAFQAPKARNAARTLGLMGAIAIVMFVGITILALVAQVRVAEDTCALVGFAGDCASDPQLTVIAQLAGSVFGADSPAFYFVQGTTALVLVLAANTAYNGFPMLTSVLARHDLVPRQLRNRGDRLSFSNGIIALAAAAVALLVVYGADVDQLLHLYVLGVFTSFTLSQIGMVKHWNQQLSEPTTLPSDFARIRLARVVNGVGAVLTAVVLVIVLVTKFTSGAYLVVIAVPLLCLLMREVSRHYARVRRQLASQGKPTVAEPGACRRPWPRLCTSRPCVRWPSPARPGLRPSPPLRCRSTRTRPKLCAPPGPTPRSPSRSRSSAPRSATSPRRSSTTSSGSAWRARGTSSPSAYRNMSSPTGGRSCCTTRAPCGSSCAAVDETSC